MAHSIFYVNDSDKNKNKLKSPKLKQVTAQERIGEKRATVVRMQRRRLSRIAILFVIIVFSGLVFLLNEQRKVLQITAENAKIQYSIRELTRENAERREALSKNLDLDKIREDAERLGLQTPLESQIIELKADQTDQIILNINEANAISRFTEPDEVVGILSNLEGFFKTIH